MDTQFTVKGRLLIEVIRANGTRDLIEKDNLVVTTGLGFIASRMKDASATAMSHMAIGSSSTAPAAGNTTLGSELGRVDLTSTTVTNSQVAYVATFPAGTGTGTIEEAGLFNATPAGTMLSRALTGTITKGAGDAIIITWTITVS